MVGVGGPVVCPLLVGRDAALTALHQAFADDPTTPVIRIFGEAGIGKSRLTAELVRRLGQQGWGVRQTACFEPDRLVPLAPFLDLVADDSAVQTAIRGLVDAAASDEEREVRKRRLFDKLAAHLLGARTLLVVEDVHWSDDLSLDALLHLERRLDAAEARLVVTYRPDEVGTSLGGALAELDRRRRALDVPLHPLSPDDVGTMLEAIAGEPPDRRRRDRVVEITEGNPFFVEEVVRSLEESGGNVDEVPIPRTVREAVRRRLELLAEDIRALVTTAAVVGRRFDLELVEAVLGRSTENIVERAHALVDAQLVTDTADGRLVFRHELIRHAVYHTILGQERRMLHRRVAEAIEASAPDPASVVADLAFHFHASGAWPESMEYGTRAANRAGALHAPGTAVEHLDRVAEASDRLGREMPADLLDLRARMNGILGHLDRALEDRQALLEAARHSRDRRAEWQALLDVATTVMARDWDAAGPHLEEALALARDLDDRVLVARTLNRTGNWRLNRGGVQEARRLHEEALSILEEVGEREDLAATVDFIAIASVFECDLPATRHHYARATDLFRELDDRPALVNALAMLAFCPGSHQFLASGVPALDLPSAIHSAEQAVDMAREMESATAEAFALGNLSTALAEAGRLSEGLAAVDEAVRISIDIEHLPWICRSYLDRAVILYDCLFPDEALDDARRSVDWGERARVSVFTGSSLASQARCELALGRMGDAETTLERAEEISAGTLTARQVAHGRAELHLARGDADAAVAVLQELVESAPGRSEGPAPPRLQLLEGDALLVLERSEEARGAFASALDTARSLGNAVVEWQALAGLARAHHMRGDEPATRAVAREAVERVETLAASLHGDRATTFRERALERVPGWGRRTPDADAYDGLTLRQRQVAALVARGMTNKEIAEELMISPLTAETHVKHILTRLGYSSRAQIAGWAKDKGLA